MRRIAAALLLALTSWFAQAGGVEQLHQFLATTRTFKADFSQIVIGKAGRKPQQSSGKIAIARPGKLRWEIEKPYPQLMVGDGGKFWIYDPELKQVTVRPAGQAIGSSPAALLSGNDELERNFILKEGGEAEGMTWVEAVPKTTDSGFEKVRLGFVQGTLGGMELADNFGQTTHVRFTRAERNAALGASLFKFSPPPGADVVGE